ncbi:MAG: glycine cleavage system aminomethyltransferase GcvT [Alphaproteobacteria bacterium]|nr:MAG: glycine cleavage system aminomethyltransferase GcvT [Alphaproteobacteria bacterium]
MSADALKTTPLHDLHLALGAKMVPFAGYSMPVHYADGIIAEHRHCRTRAGLFDVSHMGQAFLVARDGADPAAAIERLVPGAIATLKPGRMRYTVLLNDAGGIRDDLMVTRTAEADGRLFLVVNAAVKDADFAHISDALADAAVLERLDDRALLALQGPRAAAVLGEMVPEVCDLVFMQALDASWRGVPLAISRSGYTGEDGFEISLPADAAETFARTLLEHPDVAPIGLGARDSLRLEAGLCLYGHDIDETTTPVEADLVWAIAKSRRERADFPGAAHILKQLAEGPARRRVGIRPGDRTIAREGTPVRDAKGERVIGRVTSGGFGPSIDGPIAMGYVETALAEPGTGLMLEIRGKLRPAAVAALPFVPHRYVR